MKTKEQKMKHAKYMSEYYKKPENRKKKNEYNKEYRKKNWNRVRDWERDSAERNNTSLHHRKRCLMRRYAITIEEYEQIFEQQKGVCAICGGNNLDNRRLSVDHNHKTGIIRGLLCNSCNRKLGWYEILKNNIEKYLQTQG